MRFRASHISWIDQPVLDVDPFRGTHADRRAGSFQDVVDKSRRRSLAIRPRHRNDGNCGADSGREQHVDDWFRHVPRQSQSGLEVHSETWGSINLDNPTSVFIQRCCQIRCDYVHPSDIQADQLDRPFSNMHVCRMDFIRDVYSRTSCGQVRGGLQGHHLALWKHRIQIVTGISDESFGLIVNRNLGQDIFMSIAS